VTLSPTFTLELTYAPNTLFTCFQVLHLLSQTIFQVYFWELVFYYYYVHDLKTEAIDT